MGVCLNHLGSELTAETKVYVLSVSRHIITGMILPM